MPMDRSIPGTALVTGAAKRIGRAISLYLAARGWSVALHCRHSGDEAEALAGQIRSMGVQAGVFAADLADLDAVQALVPKVKDAMGPLHLLVNNASVFERDDIRTADADGWTRHIDTNLRAPFFLTQAFAAQLPDGAEGNVINVADMRVWRLTPHFASYTISKAALWTLTQTSAMALAPLIRVNAIGPGPILPSIHQSEAQFAVQCAATPLQRGSSPEEIAAAVGFLLDAGSVTGQMIALDGGEHLPWRPAGAADVEMGGEE